MTPIRFGPPLSLLIGITFVAISISFPLTSHAQGPQSVLLVVNDQSPESMAIANHYIGLRNIPGRNVVYLSLGDWSKDNKEFVGTPQFRDKILKPIEDAIRSRKLEDQIDVITFSSGFPTRLNCNEERKTYEAATGKKYDIHFHAPFLSLTSGIFLKESLFDKSTYFMDSDANWYAKGGKETRAFSSQTYWDKQGQPSDANSGRRYMLATALGVVREGGSTVEQVKEQLTRSREADGTQPKGLFYFANNGDPRTKTRASQFKETVEALKALGHEAEIGNAVVPANKTIAGATLGSPKHDWPASKSKFVKGAICDNFTSYGGWWEKNQTHLTHYLNHGAAMSVGTVYEPYTIAYKIPTAYTHVHYAKGLTAAESLYSTIGNPFQLLIVGDPLCRPFAELPKFSVSGIEDQSVVEEDLVMTAKPEEGSPPIKRFAFFVDETFQANIKPNQNVRLAKVDLGVGFHEFRFVAVADSPIEASETKIIRCFVWPENRKADLRIDLDQKELKLADTLSVKCRFEAGQKVVLRHNNRLLGKFQSSNKALTIPAEKLGRGTSKIYATTETDEGTYSGVPVEVTIK